MFTTATRLTVQVAVRRTTFTRVNAARSFTSSTPLLADQYDVVIIGTHSLPYLTVLFVLQ